MLITAGATVNYNDYAGFHATRELQLRCLDGVLSWLTRNHSSQCTGIYSSGRFIGSSAPRKIHLSLMVAQTSDLAFYISNAFTHAAESSRSSQTPKSLA